MRTHWNLMLGLLIGAATYAQGDILYSVTDLGTLGGSFTNVSAINSSGQITGTSVTTTGDEHAFLYSNGQMTDLNIPGTYESFGYSINNAGQVLGELRGFSPGVGEYNHTFLYSNGQVADLGMLGGVYSPALAINNVGQITGFSEILIPSNGFKTHAFLYSNGQITDLTPSSLQAFGYGINDLGQVVGQAEFGAFLYSNGQLTQVGLLGEARAINNQGQIVGYAFTRMGTRAFLYSNGQSIDLDTLGGFDSQANAINNNGQIVGFYFSRTSQQRAFLYQDGQMLDLNTMIDPALHLTLADARAINDNGQIVANVITATCPGHGCTGLNTRSYLLTPIPEPSTLALFGVTLLGLGAYLRRR